MKNDGASDSRESPWKPAAVITALQRGYKVIARGIEGDNWAIVRRSNFSCLVRIPTYTHTRLCFRALLRQLYFYVVRFYTTKEKVSLLDVFTETDPKGAGCSQRHGAVSRVLQERKDPRFEREWSLGRACQWRRDFISSEHAQRSLDDRMIRWTRKKIVQCFVVFFIRNTFPKNGE